MKERPKPQNIIKLRNFVGGFQLFRRFIKVLLDLLAPLTNLTDKGLENPQHDKTCGGTFQKIKERITQALIMTASTASNCEEPFTYHINARKVIVEASCTQFDRNGQETFVSCFSKRLSNAKES